MEEEKNVANGTIFTGTMSEFTIYDLIKKFTIKFLELWKSLEGHKFQQQFIEFSTQII